MSTVIVAGARTPMGRMLGSLKGFSGSDLGGFAIKGALEKSGVKPGTRSTTSSWARSCRPVRARSRPARPRSRPASP
jgi:acetyl-CoA acetyltransferase